MEENYKKEYENFRFKRHQVDAGWIDFN